jgi:very-short-patch-repair endonuclease
MATRSNTEEFKNKAKLIHPEYIFDKFIYINAHTKGIVICPTHGEFACIPNNLLNGQKGCLKCKNEKMANDRMLGIDKFRERVKIVHPSYDSSKFMYVNAHTKGIMICPLHGEFKITPHNLIRYKQGCPNCKRSKGENFIFNWFTNNKYKVTKQMKFETCKDKRCLPYDFYIDGTNILIEYDGIQHSKPVERFGGELALHEAQRKDEIKNKWAKENGYQLIRFNYKQTQEEIENSLTTLLETIGK